MRWGIPLLISLSLFLAGPSFSEEENAPAPEQAPDATSRAAGDPGAPPPVDAVAPAPPATEAPTAAAPTPEPSKKARKANNKGKREIAKKKNRHKKKRRSE